jgi:chloramphenicol 3-O phosphotransferase
MRLRLAGLSVLFVGVRCPIDVIWERRKATWGQDPNKVDQGVAGSVHLAQQAVHAHGGYDLEVDTSISSPDECAELIRRRLAEGPPGTRFRLARY